MTERDLLISMSSPVAAEAERLRRKIKECEFALEVMDGVLDEVEPITRVSYELAAERLRKALR